VLARLGYAIGYMGDSRRRPADIGFYNLEAHFAAFSDLQRSTALDRVIIGH